MLNPSPTDIFFPQENKKCMAAAPSTHFTYLHLHSYSGSIIIVEFSAKVSMTIFLHVP
jgi:hypothetical protein